jgi:hypothetical protein
MEQKRKLPKQQNQSYEEQIIPEPDPLDLALLMRWTKVKDKDGKIKRVYRIVKTKK